jgi:Rrf2 family cysteine metabolism transcriptional repressor
MKLSTRGRYAARALLDLACHQGAAPIPLKDIARRQGISLYYLEHIVMPLATAGVVRSSRGASGGIRLARPPQEIRLSEILRLVEGSLAPVDCVADPALCPRAKLCVTREVWLELDRVTNAVLDSMTLYDLVKRQERKKQIEGPAVREDGEREVQPGSDR